MILPPPPPPAEGAVIEIFVLPPRSREFVAVIEPAPAFVIRRMAPQSIVTAEPTEIVATFKFGMLEIAPTGALDVPVIEKAPLTVVVTPWGNAMVFPLPTVTELKATAVFALITKEPLVLLADIVRLAKVFDVPKCA